MCRPASSASSSNTPKSMTPSIQIPHLHPAEITFRVPKAIPHPPARVPPHQKLIKILGKLDGPAPPNVEVQTRKFHGMQVE